MDLQKPTNDTTVEGSQAQRNDMSVNTCAIGSGALGAVVNNLRARRGHNTRLPVREAEVSKYRIWHSFLFYAGSKTWNAKGKVAHQVPNGGPLNW